MSEDLEPGPNPRKIRNPLARKPDVPVRVDQVLRSFEEDQSFSIRKESEAEALKVKSEITAAVYYLNRWEDYDLRVRPYVTHHWEDRAGEEHTVDKDHPLPPGAAGTDYWKCNFWVHPPLPRGFRQMDEGTLASAHRNSARTRGVSIKQGSGSRRTVQERAD